jgi:ABC-type uncharacterized transport system ATPase subunit
MIIGTCHRSLSALTSFGQQGQHVYIGYIPEEHAYINATSFADGLRHISQMRVIDNDTI